MPVLEKHFCLLLRLLAQYDSSCSISVQASLYEQRFLLPVGLCSPWKKGLVHELAPSILNVPDGSELGSDRVEEAFSPLSASEPVLYLGSGFVVLLVCRLLDQQVAKTKRRQEELLLLVGAYAMLDEVVACQLLLREVVLRLLEDVPFSLD